MRMLRCAARWALDEVRPRQGMMAPPLSLASRGCPECGNGHGRGYSCLAESDPRGVSSEPRRISEDRIGVNQASTMLPKDDRTNTHQTSAGGCPETIKYTQIAD
jgi:hypothetical protein